MHGAPGLPGCADAFAEEGVAVASAFGCRQGHQLLQSTHGSAWFCGVICLPSWGLGGKGRGEGLNKALFRVFWGSLPPPLLVQSAPVLLPASHCGPGGARSACFTCAACHSEAVLRQPGRELSQKEPLCFVLQALGFHCCWLGVALSTSHVAGARNVWADTQQRMLGRLQLCKEAVCEFGGAVGSPMARAPFGWAWALVLFPMVSWRLRLGMEGSAAWAGSIPSHATIGEKEHAWTHGECWGTLAWFPCVA